MNKKNLDLKTTFGINSYFNKKQFQNLKKINSMTKISPLSINISEIKKRENSNLKVIQKKKGILLNIENLFENKGKITLKLKNSNNNDGLSSSRYLNLRKIKNIKIKSESLNNISNYNKRNFIKVLNNDNKNMNIKRSGNNYKQILFKSKFYITNLSRINSKNNSIKNEKDKINNLKSNNN